MSDTLLPAVEAGPDEGATASIVWLHGLGADGHDFEPIVPELQRVLGPSIRFVFPHAPSRPVTINGGAVMPAWYDITSLESERHASDEDLQQARGQLEAWIRHEEGLGIPTKKILVAGFSQGGAIALYTGLAFDEPLAGILALSCYHPAREQIDADANRDVPIFMAHGTFDPVVPLRMAEKTVETLRAAGLRAGVAHVPDAAQPVRRGASRSGGLAQAGARALVNESERSERYQSIVF